MVGSNVGDRSGEWERLLTIGIFEPKRSKGRLELRCGGGGIINDIDSAGPVTDEVELTMDLDDMAGSNGVRTSPKSRWLEVAGEPETIGTEYADTTGANALSSETGTGKMGQC